MKCTLSFLLALVVVVALAGPSLAYPRAVDKFVDGAKGIVTSPLVVRDHVMKETKDANVAAYPFALGGGLLKGGFYMGKQIIEGSWAILTSPLEIAK